MYTRSARVETKKVREFTAAEGQRCIKMSRGRQIESHAGRPREPALQLRTRQAWELYMCTMDWNTRMQK